MLRAIRAPLKIVIAGNHDCALDGNFWSGESAVENHGFKPIPRDPEYRTEALEMIEAAEEDGVVYIPDEGVHKFILGNGAVLTIFVSPWTPEYGYWGFQYPPEKGHKFDIPAGIDIAMTHGPPRGVLDLAGFKIPRYGMMPTPAGCPDLFTAVARAKPRVHCFGHIHEAWGAYLARWKTPDTNAETKDKITAQDAIDGESSKSIVKLEDLKPMTHADPPATPEQVARLLELAKARGVYIDFDKETQGRDGETLFINAAIQGYRQKASQLPFIVDILLDKATSDAKRVSLKARDEASRI